MKHMSEYIKKDKVITIINEFIPPSRLKDDILEDMNELSTIDGRSDLEIIKEYCEKIDTCSVNCIIDDKDSCCFITKILKSLPSDWDLDEIKEVVKKIKGA